MSTEDIATTGLDKEDGGKLKDDHKRDKKVGIMVVVGLVGTTMMVDFLTELLEARMSCVFAYPLLHKLATNVVTRPNRNSILRNKKSLTSVINQHLIGQIKKRAVTMRRMTQQDNRTDDGAGFFQPM